MTYRAQTNTHVSKAFFTREGDVSASRTLQAGAGLGLAAWGIRRSPMIGPALARGVRMTMGSDGERVAQAIEAATVLRNRGRFGRVPTARDMRHIQHLNDTLDRVNRSHRPQVAAAAGLLLAGSAFPLRVRRPEDYRYRWS